MEYHAGDKTTVVRLDLDDSVKESLLSVVKQEDIAAASVTGLGALKDFTLGYFQPDIGEYKQDQFDKPHELTNATGVITQQDGQPHIHLHATLAGPEHEAIGGHLHEGVIAAAGEFFLTPFDCEINRQHDSDLNLDLMHFPHG
jgi:predicted DNA-binding protein with PD1-like motif